MQRSRSSATAYRSRSAVYTEAPSPLFFGLTRQASWRGDQGLPQPSLSAARRMCSKRCIILSAIRRFDETPRARAART